MEHAKDAADTELKAQTVMSASPATPATATIGTRNRSKKLFCWAYGRARSRRPARTLLGRVVGGRWLVAAEPAGTGLGASEVVAGGEPGLLAG